MPPKKTGTRPDGKSGKSGIPSLGKSAKGTDPDPDKDGVDAADSEPESSTEVGISKILNQLAAMDLNINHLTQELREGKQATEFKVAELDDKVTALEDKSVEDREKTQKVVDVTEGLRTRSNVHAIRLAEVEKKIEQLERDKRKKIIVVEGVPESEESPSPEIIDELFRDLKVEFDTLVCDRIHRRGKQPQGTGDGRKPEAAENNKVRRREKRHRPIIVGFKELGDKIQIYKHIKNLQGLERWAKVFINDDLTECQQNQARDLRALAAFSRSKGCPATVRSCCIIVRGRKYDYSELYKLGPELTLEKAKTIECLEGKGIAFQSEHSPLSNLYPCNLVYKGKLHLSAEGALHYTRAVFCRRHEEAKAIGNETNPYEVKRIASTFAHPPEWDGIVVDTLIEILVIKFTTDTHCKKALLATGDRRLFEATGDRIWACGLPLTKIHELTLPAPGKNRTGEAVEKVRSIIRSK